MRFVVGRCVNCGMPRHDVSIDNPFENSALERDGSIIHTDFWFCSVDCYQQAILSYLPRGYSMQGDHLDNDPDYKKVVAEVDNQPGYPLIEGTPQYERLRSFLEGWKLRQVELFADAHDSLVSRLLHEDDLLKAQRQAKEDAEMAKIADQERVQREERERLAELMLSKPIPQSLRFEHTHILGPSGSGKTTLLQHIVFNDFYDFAAKQFRADSAYVIIDPKGDLVERISHLAIFQAGNAWADRLVIVDPLDYPALNVFDAAGRNPAQIISTFSYIFSTTRQQFTGKQDTCFSFCVDLLFRMPRSNLFTFLNLLDDRTTKGKEPDPRFAEAISELTAPSEAAMRRFFEVDFYSPTYASTRQEIKTRLWEILKDRHLFAMLNASERKLDIAQCIREKKIVLVNTRMATLKVGHQTLGRYILSLAVDAIQNRANEPPSTWHPAYIVIDEFQEFADAIKVPEMLRLIRVYYGGAVLAHHNMYCTEFDDTIRSAISTNTSIKYATGQRGLDINYMARDLQCDSDFLTKQCVKTATHARFACYFTGLQHPFLKEVPFNEIDQWPKMDENAYSHMRLANKRRLEGSPAPPQPTSQSIPPSPPPRTELAEPFVASPKRPPSVDPDAGAHTEAAAKWGQ